MNEYINTHTYIHTYIHTHIYIYLFKKLMPLLTSNLLAPAAPGRPRGRWLCLDPCPLRHRCRLRHRPGGDWQRRGTGHCLRALHWWHLPPAGGGGHSLKGNLELGFSPYVMGKSVDSPGKLRENFEYFALFHGKIQPVSGVNEPIHRFEETSTSGGFVLPRLEWNLVHWRSSYCRVDVDGNLKLGVFFGRGVFKVTRPMLNEITWNSWLSCRWFWSLSWGIQY